MNKFEADYNTSRPPIVIRELGRNFQKMVQYVKTIEDREKRNYYAKAIINLMINFLQQKDTPELREKLWHYLYMMADYDIDVDMPCEKPLPPGKKEKPQRPEYSNKSDITFRHYGKIIEKLIQKAIEIEDPEKKAALVRSIANQMKKNYIHWNKDNVSDAVIIEHLKKLSNNQLELPDNTTLFNLSSINSSNKKNKKKYKNNKNNS